MSSENKDPGADPVSVGRALNCENKDLGAEPVLTVGRPHRRAALSGDRETRAQTRSRTPPLLGKDRAKDPSFAGSWPSASPLGEARDDVRRALARTSRPTPPIQSGSQETGVRSQEVEVRRQKSGGRGQEVEARSSRQEVRTKSGRARPAAPPRRSPGTPALR